MVAVRAGAAKCCRINGTEIRSSVHGVKKPYVGGVEEVKSFRDQLKASLLAERNCAANAQVHRAKIVAHKGVSRLDADPIVITENIAVGVKAGELGKAHRGLNRGNEAKEEVARKRIPALRSCNCPVHHDAVANIVGRKRAFRAEILAVLRYQHKARIRAIIDGLSPGVAQAEGKIVRQPPIHIDKQAVVLRIPPRGRFKIDSNGERAHAGIERARNRSHSTIFIFGTRATARVVQSYHLRRIRLVHVEEAAKMNATNMQAADADGCIWQRIKFDGEAGLHTVRVLVILIETHHHGRPEESAVRDRRAAGKRIRERIRSVVRVRSIFHKPLQGKRSNRRRARKREKLGLGVQPILKRSPRILANRPTTGGLLARKQWRRNDAVEQTKAGAHDNVALRADVVREAHAWIDVLPLCVQHV